jgi:hypothetical protein
MTELLKQADEKMMPSDDYTPLRRQFCALRNLYMLQEKRLSELSRRDYSLQEASLKKLEISLESERDMNDTLTKELEALSTKVRQQEWQLIPKDVEEYVFYWVTDGEDVVQAEKTRCGWREADSGSISIYEPTYYKRIIYPTKPKEEA